MGFFFFATPILKESEERTWVAIKENCFRSGSMVIADGSKFTIEKDKLRLSSLDSMMALNDALVKVDAYLEGVLKKVERQIFELDPNHVIKIETTQGKMNVLKYIQTFVWDESRFQRSKSLGDICHIIAERMHSMDNDIKKQMQDFNDSKNTLASLKKKEEGNLMTRDLGDIIYESNMKKDLFVNSMFLCTLIAIVHKSKLQNWYENYEKNIEENVVPRSSQFLNYEDKEGFQMHRIVIFKTHADSFITNAKSKFKFAVKPFKYDEAAYLEEKKEKAKLQEQIRLQHMALFNACHGTFSELFIALIHLKAIRLYIEGVMRFGVPPQFCSCFANTGNKDKQVTKNLIKLFADPKMSEMYGSKEELEDAEDYFPFVMLTLNVPSELN